MLTARRSDRWRLTAPVVQIAIAADGISRATLNCLTGEPKLVRCRRLPKYEGPTTLSVLAKYCRRGVIAKPTVDARPINIEFAWRILGDSMLEIGHTCNAAQR